MLTSEVAQSLGQGLRQRRFAAIIQLRQEPFTVTRYCYALLLRGLGILVLTLGLARAIEKDRSQVSFLGVMKAFHD